MQVTAITRRNDAIYHVILAGGTEDSTLAWRAAADGSLQARFGLSEKSAISARRTYLRMRRHVWKRPAMNKPAR